MAVCHTRTHTPNLSLPISPLSFDPGSRPHGRRTSSAPPLTLTLALDPEKALVIRGQMSAGSKTREQHRCESPSRRARRFHRMASRVCPCYRRYLRSPVPNHAPFDRPALSASSAPMCTQQCNGAQHNTASYSSLAPPQMSTRRRPARRSARPSQRGSNSPTACPPMRRTLVDKTGRPTETSLPYPTELVLAPLIPRLPSHPFSWFLSSSMEGCQGPTLHSALWTTGIQ